MDPNKYTNKALTQADHIDKANGDYLLYEEFVPAVLAEISLKLDRIISVLERVHPDTSNGSLVSSLPTPHMHLPSTP